MSRLFVGLAALAAASLIPVGSQAAYLQTTSQAAAPPAAMTAITPESHAAAVVKNGVIVPNGSSKPSAPLGWNYFHATYCSVYYDGSTTWVYVYPQEGGYWYTNTLLLGTTMLTQCVTGDWMAVYVVVSSSGYFNQTWTYDYK